VLASRQVKSEIDTELRDFVREVSKYVNQKENEEVNAQMGFREPTPIPPRKGQRSKRDLRNSSPGRVKPGRVKISPGRKRPGSSPRVKAKRETVSDEGRSPTPGRRRNSLRHTLPPKVVIDLFNCSSLCILQSVTPLQRQSGALVDIAMEITNCSLRDLSEKRCQVCFATKIIRVLMLAKEIQSKILSINFDSSMKHFTDGLIFIFSKYVRVLEYLNRQDKVQRYSMLI
jgi:hypothetical protein